MKAKLKGHWDSYTKLMERFGNFQATVIFSLLYYIFIFPTGLIVTPLADYMGRRRRGWADVGDFTSTKQKMKRQ